MSRFYGSVCICEGYAIDFDLKFNVEKSKRVTVSSRQWRHLPSVGDRNVCQFFLDGKPIEHVKSYILDTKSFTI